MNAINGWKMAFIVRPYTGKIPPEEELEIVKALFKRKEYHEGYVSSVPFQPRSVLYRILSIKGDSPVLKIDRIGVSREDPTGFVCAYRPIEEHRVLTHKL